MFMTGAGVQSIPRPPECHSAVRCATIACCRMQFPFTYTAINAASDPTKASQVCVRWFRPESEGRRRARAHVAATNHGPSHRLLACLRAPTREPPSWSAAMSASLARDVASSASNAARSCSCSFLSDGASGPGQRHPGA